MEIKYAKCLIIGNGFDVSLGLATKYSEFLVSKQWKDLCAENNKRKSYSLIKYVQKQYNNKNWSDLEAILLEYAQNYKDICLSEDVVSDIKREFHEIVDTLILYLKEETKNNAPNIESCAAQLLIDLFLMDNDTKVFTFNYTPLDLYFKSFSIIPPSSINAVHGSLNGNDIILGIECEDFREINSKLSFMIKSNQPSFHSTEINEIMFQSKETIIYGHSMSYIDRFYFVDFLKYCEQNREDRTLRIITCNEESEMAIKDNMRLMGINVPRLYQNINVVFEHVSK